MARSLDEPGGAEEAQAVERALAGWRAARPQATLGEIEREVDRQLAVLRAGLIERLALAGPVAATPPACPDCGGAMAWDGERSRRLTTGHDQTIDLPRRYARCPHCGTGLFPPG